MKRLLILLLLTACTQELHFTSWDNGLPKEGEWRTNLAMGDVNNDGLADIAGIGRKGNAYASVWLNNGNGSWKLAVDGIPREMQCGVGANFGDVNNDGKLDIAFGQHCGGAVIYLGDGTGKWTNYSKGLLPDGVNPIALADFDNDGLPDIITLGAFLEGFTVYKNTGTGWELKNTTLPTEITATAYQIITPDINNDNLPDIISTGGKIQAFLNNGNFTFEETGPEVNAFFTYLDYNNNFLAASGAQQLLVYKNFELYRNLTASCENGGGVAFEDINNDEKLDLVASCITGIRTFLGPDFHEVNNNIPLIEGLPHGLHVADVNNDGKKDIIAAFGKEDTGGIYVLVQN